MKERKEIDIQVASGKKTLEVRLIAFPLFRFNLLTIVSIVRLPGHAS